MSNLYRLNPREVPGSAGSGVVYQLDPINQLGDRVTVIQVGHTSLDGGPVRVTLSRSWLIPVADARNTDPDTAHAAAELHTDTLKRASHRLVLQLLGRYGACTDHELAMHAARETGRRYTHDSIGKRRLEVQRLGFVEKTGETRPTESGAHAMTWQITRAGKAELANWTTAA